MEIALSSAIYIIMIHWLADFVMQRGDWAKEKSIALKPLLKHTIMYSLVWAFCLFTLILPVKGIIIFTLITFITHTLTDYLTSKWVQRKFKRNDLGDGLPNTGAFTIIGADQVFHYVQLFITFAIIF